MLRVLDNLWFKAGEIHVSRSVRVLVMQVEQL